MSSRIQLLPDNIANQIAAGEVISRPANAVKELLENAVDAGATEIKLFINDAGKALIQVTDNGSGMSEDDARMAFERHATSKIRNIDDLFHVRTMGFRGEALASIAAVSQVEMKTRREEDEAGTCICVENSTVTKMEPIAFARGTSISMKNLFYNVPARRNFLKSNTAEMRHIVDEFIRVALSFPQIFFSLTSNGQQIFHLESGSLKQRLVQLLGNNYASKIIGVKEETAYLNIYGFMGKPETAKRTRGDQYFFVNNRFIKSPYLNHAVQQAYQDLVPSDSFPMYALFIDLDPAQVDVNVHPTKQEIKFEDEKIVYAFVQAAVKHALAQFSVTPTLDFELDSSIQSLESIQKPFTSERQTAMQGSGIYQTFTEANQAHKIEASSPLISQRSEGFVSLSRHFQDIPQVQTTIEITGVPIQLALTYILVQSSAGFYLIHQQSAHERVIYDRLSAGFMGTPLSTQQSLFPQSVELTPADAIIMQEIIPDLLQMGYQIEPFGGGSFIIQGTPSDVPAGNEKEALEKILEQYKHFSELRLPRRELLLRSVAAQQALRSGVALEPEEMKRLVADLFSSEVPNATPSGKPIYMELKKEALERMFGR